MVITEFPNSNRSTIPFADFKAKLGNENVVVMASHDHLFTTFENAPLSIKTTLGGQESYHFDRKINPVDADTFILLNKGRTYESIIDSDFSINSFSLFFKDGMADNVLVSFLRTPEANLDQPDADYPSGLFIEQLMDKKGPVGDVLLKIKDLLSEEPFSQLLIDELFYEMAEALVRHHKLLIERVDDVDSIKQSTRIEIYHRLARVRAFIHANYFTDLMLADLAGVAHMSEYHFLRMFKSFFATTPYHYITNRRIFKSKEYLLQTDYAVKKICRKVGYTDESSFSRLFKKYTNMTPTIFRSLKN